MVYLTEYYFRTNRGTDFIPMCNEDKIGSFMKTFGFKVVNDFIDFLFVLAFSYMVLKMKVFWDFLYFEKIQTVYNECHLFEQEE